MLNDSFIYKEIMLNYYGGPFCILGWTASVVLWPNNSGIGESRLVQLELTLSQLVHKQEPLGKDLGHVPTARNAVIKMLQQEKRNIAGQLKIF